jgi:hypothetical protein
MKIEIIVATDGKTTVQTIGFQGSSCREGSRFLEQALGSRLSEKLPERRRSNMRQPTTSGVPSEIAGLSA